MSTRKRRSWTGRVYLGRDEHGRTLYHWVGRFPTRRERDDAVAQAKVERPWVQETLYGQVAPLRVTRDAKRDAEAS